VLAFRFSMRELEGGLDPGLEDMSFGSELDMEPGETESGVGLGLQATKLSEGVSSPPKAVKLSRVKGPELTWENGRNEVS